jgi:hypothetical protein
MGDNIETRSLTLNFAVIYCDYELEYDQTDFVASETQIIGNIESTPYTITFPSFKQESGSDTSCGTVTQTLDTSSFPSDWVVTYSDSGDNIIEIPSFDADGAAVYNVEYNAVMGSSTQARQLILSFEVVYCEFEEDYEQSSFIASPDVIDVLVETAPFTITFPSFKSKAGSHSECGSVVQALDSSSLPIDWTVTLSDTDVSSIEIP